MTPKAMRDIAQEVAAALTAAEHVAQERDMLRKVLRQAVLTHGGVLVVDPKHAAEAAAGHELFIGGGKVTITF